MDLRRVIGELIAVGLTGLGSVSGALASVHGSPPAANLVKNPDFALPKPANFASVGPGTGYVIPHWTWPSTGVQVPYETAMQMPGSIKSACKLYFQGPSSVSQTIATIAGKSYVLQWWGAGEPDSGLNALSVRVLWNGSPVASETYKTAGYSFTKMNWVLHKVTVNATSSSSTLEFADGSPVTPPGYGPVVTGVTLTTATM